MTAQHAPGTRWLRCDLHVHTPCDGEKRFGENLRTAIRGAQEGETATPRRERRTLQPGRPLNDAVPRVHEDPTVGEGSDADEERANRARLSRLANRGGEGVRRSLAASERHSGRRPECGLYGKDLLLQIWAETSPQEGE